MIDGAIENPIDALGNDVRVKAAGNVGDAKTCSDPTLDRRGC